MGAAAGNNANRAANRLEIENQTPINRKENEMDASHLVSPEPAARSVRAYRESQFLRYGGKKLYPAVSRSE